MGEPKRDRRFTLALKQFDDWDQQAIWKGFEQFDPARAETADMNKRLVKILQSITQVDRVITQGRSMLITFRNEDEWFIFKIFLKVTDFLQEAALLLEINEDPLLSQYIAPFDYNTLASEGAIIYKRLVPLRDVVNQMSPRRIRDLITWNHQLLADFQSKGKRMCDHKIENVLYDPEEHVFYVTDLEGITKSENKCRIWTYIDINTSQEPLLFDHLHFIASLYHLSGVEVEMDRYITHIAKQYKDPITRELGHDFPNDFFYVSILCLTMLDFQTNRPFLGKIKKGILEEPRRPAVFKAPQVNKQGMLQALLGIAKQVIREHLKVRPSSPQALNIAYLLQEHKAAITKDL